jgi:hypothetical protein
MPWFILPGSADKDRIISSKSIDRLPSGSILGTGEKSFPQTEY